MRVLVGKASLLVEKDFLDNGYECAAWWRKVRCQPQTVELFLSDEIGTPTLRFAFEGHVVDADFTSHFGGMPFGRYDKSQDVGKPAKYFMSPYEYAILNAAFAGQNPYPECALEIDPQKASVLAHEFDHKEFSGIKTHYHLVPAGQLQARLESWKTVKEYLNLRVIEIPELLRGRAEPAVA